MRLVIDIPENVKVAISSVGLLRLSDEMIKVVDTAIQRSIPLPKEHGRLIDADELYLDLQTDEKMRLGNENLRWVEYRIDYAPTIVEGTQ